MISLVITGHVDHGKSTLIGRLLYETDSLTVGKKEEIEALSLKRGMDMEWAYCLDAYQAERNQAITIDTTQIHFKTAKKRYLLIDCPGHKEFLKNMITGAAHANIGVLVIDANKGMEEQTKRHAYLLSLMGIKTLLVVLNKMDKNPQKVENVKKDITDYCISLDINLHSFIPVSAKFGQGLVESFDGISPSFLETLDTLEDHKELHNFPLFRIQDIDRIHEERILVGHLDQGKLPIGESLIFYPTEETSRIKAIKGNGKFLGITLEDPLFVERGHIGVSPDQKIKPIEGIFTAQLFWMSKEPLKIHKTYKGESGCQACSFYVEDIHHVIDTHTLEKNPTQEIHCHDIAFISFKSSHPLFWDRFVIFDHTSIVGVGIIQEEK